MAFTFTEKAAESIKRRVSQALATAGLDPTVIGAMYIGTIHSYCQRTGRHGRNVSTVRRFDENRLKLYMISRYHRLGLQSFRPRARNNSYFDTVKQASDAWKTANDELLDFNRSPPKIKTSVACSPAFGTVSGRINISISR